jgi:D-lactate dehydrogenase
MHDVFFFEAFAEEAEMLRSVLPAGLNAGFTAATIQESPHWNVPAPIVSVRTQSDIPPAWAAGGLRAILSRSTGYDHLIEYRRATNTELALGYLPLYCARAVAEQAMLLWMTLLRRLPLQMRHFHSFNRDGLTGRECEGKNLLVVGVGNIGKEVAAIGRSLGMTVRGVDIVKRHPTIDYVAIEEGLASADVVVCAMNLTRDNRGFFHYDMLAGCKRDALFVNVARGEFVSSVDLLRLLEERRLGGVGLDVYCHETVLAGGLRAGMAAGMDPESNATLQLAQRGDVVLTPHNAFNTLESVRRKAAQSIEQVETFRRTGEFKWSVPWTSDIGPRFA